MRFLILLLLLPATLFGQFRKKKDYVVTITTDFGVMNLLLYDQTPKHKENFIKLTKRGYYDSLLFHRIIEGFMIQGGDPDSKTAVAGQALGEGDVGYRVPAEFRPELFHKKGVIAAARDNNPEKASSGAQFYITQGRVWNDSTLAVQIARGVARGGGRAPTDEQRQIYKTLGGTPHLDGNYTVYGEVIRGLAVVDSIAKQPRDARDRPLKNIRMAVSGQWVKKKKITQEYGYVYK